MKHTLPLLKHSVPIFLVVFILLGFIFLSRQISSIHRDLGYFKNSQTSDKVDLGKQLALLREELIKYKNQQEGRDQILGLAALNKTAVPATSMSTDTAKIPSAAASALPSIKGIVQLKKNWETADVFQDPKASSKIIGQVVKDKLYYVYEIDAHWFKIDYKFNQLGWIQASLVDEF